MTDPAEDRERELAELLEEVRRIEVQAKRLVIDILAGGYVSVFRGAGIEFSEVREYVEGDDPRSVDWNVTARVGRPYVKKYVDERELTLLFLLDLSPSMSGAFSPWSSRQAAARIAACLALSAVRNDDKVGLIAFDDEVRRFVRPEKGASHALRIIRDCLALEGRGRGSRFAPALQLLSRAMRRRSIVFLISDFLAEGWEESLRLAARRHDLVAVRILPPELAPPEGGFLRLEDPETGRVTAVDWSGEKVREAYRRRVETWKAETAEMLRRAGVDRMDVPIPADRESDAFVRPILDFFRMREERGEKR